MSKTQYQYKSGDVYGDIMLTGKSFFKNGHLMVEFICKCGDIAYGCFSKIFCGHSKSCGCRKKKLVHGLSYSPIYGHWEGLKARCYNKNHKQYNDYGGRGIEICDEWKNNFKSFYDWAIDNGYSKELSLERKNNNGNYEPNNCKWATSIEQSRNKRSNIFISAFGETKCVSDWAKDIRCRVSFNTIIYRIKKMNLLPEIAISTPNNKFVNRKY